MPQLKEKPLLFGRNGSLVGVLTFPGELPSTMAVVILSAGILHRVGPSRISVHLARRLARAGCTVLRFDLSGIGDSPLDSGAPSLEASVLADIDDAITTVLRECESDGVVLLGFCSGADNAYHVAADDPRVRGVVLLDPSIERTKGFHRRRALKRLLSFRSWMNLISGRSVYLRIKRRLGSPPPMPPEFFMLLTSTGEEYVRRAKAGLESGVRYFFMFSGGIEDFCNSPMQVEEALQEVFSPDRMRVVLRSEMDHILSRKEDQEWMGDAVAGWIEENWGASDSNELRFKPGAPNPYLSTGELFDADRGEVALPGSKNLPPCALA